MHEPSQNHPPLTRFVMCENCGVPIILAATGRPRVYAFCDKPDCLKVAAAARARASRAGIKRRPIDPPLVAMTGSVHHSNRRLIAAAVGINVLAGARVADVTFGRGVFWRNTQNRRFTLLRSDLRPLPGVNLVADFRALPYADNSLDVLVLDPPYAQTDGIHFLESQYGGAATIRNFNHRQIIDLYAEGMTEAKRVLCRGGQLWVKTQDECQDWSHIEIRELAIGLGFRARDLLIMASHPIRTRRWGGKQKHAYKTHSYLWIFGK
jgi:hypothetical protein